MDGPTIKQTLHDEAAALGFALFGVSAPDYPAREVAAYARWLADGFHADMAYLETRRDIAGGLAAVLPGVRSVIVLGMPYFHAARHADTGPRARISRYATGRDYHRAFEKRQKKLGRTLKSLGDTPRAFVDYGPVMERVLAMQAGFGFIGKNGCLIHPKYGSYVFLGVILSTLDLPKDAPISGSCGDCTRCLSACPTGALNAERLVDARRCISYQTIENKGTIPADLRPRMGRWILGCDLCQLVCPYNRRATPGDQPDFQGQRLELRPQIAELFAIGENDFAECFAGNAAMRPKRTGLLRNAAIAAGNSGDPALLPVLEAAFKREGDAVLREHLRWAIAQLRH